MKRIFVALLAAVLVVAGWVHPADARDLPTGGMTADEVAAWLRTANYPATVKPDPSTPGDQIISSSVDGINFDIYLYQCAGGRCKSLQYVAGWTPQSAVTSDRINVWDRDQRYGRAYVAKSGAVFCEYDLDLDPGGTYELLDHSLVRWRGVIDDFKHQIIG